jgi:hypothetical protein
MAPKREALSSADRRVGEAAFLAAVKVFDKSERTDGTFSRSDFAYDPEGDLYVFQTEKAAQNAATWSHRRG